MFAWLKTRTKTIRKDAKSDITPIPTLLFFGRILWTRWLRRMGRACRRLLGGETSSVSRLPKRRHPRPTRRLVLEGLEDRTMPSVTLVDAPPAQPSLTPAARYAQPSMPSLANEAIHEETRAAQSVQPAMPSSSMTVLQIQWRQAEHPSVLGSDRGPGEAHLLSPAGVPVAVSVWYGGFGSNAGRIFRSASPVVLSALRSSASVMAAEMGGGGGSYTTAAA